LQRQEFRHGQEEDDQVEEDVEGAVDVDPFLEGQAGACVLAVPLGPEETYYLIVRMSSWVWRTCFDLLGLHSKAK
jgi:hypothetical protein